MTAPPDPQRFVVDLSAAPLPLRQPWQWCVGSGHATPRCAPTGRPSSRRRVATSASATCAFTASSTTTWARSSRRATSCSTRSSTPTGSSTSCCRIGMKPVVELSFMPRALSSGNDERVPLPGQHHAAARLRAVGRAGAAAGRALGRALRHRRGRELAVRGLERAEPAPLLERDQEAYFALYDATARALKAVDARLQVGGPATRRERLARRLRRALRGGQRRLRFRRHALLPDRCVRPHRVAGRRRAGRAATRRGADVHRRRPRAAVGQPAAPVLGAGGMSESAHDSELLRHLQENSFGYFIHEVNRQNGLVLDKTEEDWPASIAAVGMALTAYPVGVDAPLHGARRGRRAHPHDLALLRRQRAKRGRRRDRLPRLLLPLPAHAKRQARVVQRALEHRHRAPDRRRARRRRILRRRSADETEIRALATMLYERVEWDWMLQGSTTLCHGWQPEPEAGFLPYRWEGYDEALILYLLALGSPTHPHRAGLLRRVVQHLRVEEGLRHRLPVCGAALHPPAVARLDRLSRHPRRLHAREGAATISRTAGARRWSSSSTALRNPLGLAHVGELCWGVTASDGPGPADQEDRRRRARLLRLPGARRSRTAPTTARWRRGRWWPRCRSRPRSCCRRCRTFAGSRSRSPIRTASRRRSIRCSLAPTRATASAGSRGSTSASTKGQRC